MFKSVELPTIQLPNASQLLDQFRQVAVDIKAEGSVPSGTLRIGANPSFGHTLFPRLAEKYWATYPNVRLHFITDLTASIQELVRRGDLDLAIVAFPDKDSDFIKTPLTSESRLRGEPSSCGRFVTRWRRSSRLSRNHCIRRANRGSRARSSGSITCTEKSGTRPTRDRTRMGWAPSGVWSTS